MTKIDNGWSGIIIHCQTPSGDYNGLSVPHQFPDDGVGKIEWNSIIWPESYILNGIYWMGRFILMLHMLPDIHLRYVFDRWYHWRCYQHVEAPHQHFRRWNLWTARHLKTGNQTVSPFLTFSSFNRDTQFKPLMLPFSIDIINIVASDVLSGS